MEAVALAALLNTILPKLLARIGNLWEEKLAIEVLIDDIKQEVPLVYDSLQAGYSDEKITDGRSKAKLMEFDRRLKVLCQDTHECVHRFLKSSLNCTEFRLKIDGYKNNLLRLKTELESSLASFRKTDQLPDMWASSCMDDDHVVDLVEPLAGILGLVKQQEDKSGGTAPKVISIVGFGGSGKTVLARQAYHDSGVVKEFSLRAWVTAAGKHPEEVVNDILNQVDTVGKNRESTSSGRLIECLKEYLKGKRYLIVIDDMWKADQWNGIRNIFRDANSVIIVTTTIQIVANACSKCINGYVCKLSPLDDKKSRHLFSKVCPSIDPRDILKKCDGLPLAIDSVARIMHCDIDNFDGARDGARRQLCSKLLKQDCTLTKLQSVLMKKYTRLPAHAIRSCLLYFCMYKKNMAQVPGRNSLIRRWQAEGFVVAETGRESLKTLIDHNVIQSMGISTDGTTRRCRPPGVMVEYISQISMSENFAALVSDLVEAPNDRIRRLSFHENDGIRGATDDRIISGMKLKFLLTLAVSGNGCEAIMDFKKYELLAVLDLKECTNLDEKRHISDICCLLELKYLSLGKTIKEIPRAIGKLVLLETLEISTTETVKVYREILKLPKLKHFLGKFQLIDELDKDLQKFLSNKSELETITGFVTKTARGFPQLMQHMKGLRKVKIVCTADSNDKQCKEDREVLPTAIKAFVREGTNMAGHRFSLSIDFAGCTPAPLQCLRFSGSLTALKLRGKLGPSLGSQQFTNISGINKLCLSDTGLSGETVLACLTNLKVLEYLKLEGDQLEPIVINPGNFRKLIRLCLVNKGALKVMTIKPQALPRLASFHLICKYLDEGLQTSVGGLGSLKEIALDYEVNETIKDAWKTTAKGHPNRPDVLLIQTGAPIRKA